MAKKSVAVVTGASSGLGKEFVSLLLNESDVSEIWAVARSEQKLRELAEEFGGKIRVLAMDLSERESLKRFEQALLSEEIEIKYLINNAGFAKFCAYNDISVEESLNMIDLNISAVVALGLSAIPYMARGSYIINIASQASFFPLPYQNLYSATKAFVRNYTRALNVELRDKEIHAVAVCPGWMKTGLFDRGVIGAEKGTHIFSGMVEPRLVAVKALKDAEKGKDISVYGLSVKATHLLSKIMPQKMMMKIWLGQQKIK